MRVDPATVLRMEWPTRRGHDQFPPTVLRKGTLRATDRV